MPHNLTIVDYGLGQPGSVHDAWAFQGTQMAQHKLLIPQNHWKSGVLCHSRSHEMVG